MGFYFGLGTAFLIISFILIHLRWVALVVGIILFWAFSILDFVIVKRKGVSRPELEEEKKDVW